MIFFTPETVKYLKKNPQYKETLLYLLNKFYQPLGPSLDRRSTVHWTVMWFLHCRSDRPKFNFQLDQNSEGLYYM